MGKWLTETVCISILKALDFLDWLRALLLRDDFIWYEAVLLEPFVLLPPNSVMSLLELVTFLTGGVSLVTNSILVVYELVRLTARCRRVSHRNYARAHEVTALHLISSRLPHCVSLEAVK